MSADFVVAAIGRRDLSESDGIHVIWTPPPTAGWSLDGWDVQRREAEQRKELACRQLTTAELDTLHRILRLALPFGEMRLRQADCPGALKPVPDEPLVPPKDGGSAKRLAGALAGGAVAGSAIAGGAVAAIGISTGPRRCAVYDVRLARRHRIVQVRVGLPSALAIALRDGKAVDTRVLTDPSGVQTARFENRDVDEVLVYCAVRATSFEVCLEDKPDDDEAAWAGATLVAKGVQFPLRKLNEALTSEQDERDLAAARLFSDETFDPEAFAALSELMNDVASASNAPAPTNAAAPVWWSTVTREELDDPFVELRTWSYALALLVDPAWRRMLGFAVLDRASELDPGELYDYRVTGRFYRRDVEEVVHGFHAVPRGTSLPRAFALGPVALRTPFGAVVEQQPAPPPDREAASGRKGIALDGDPCLTLTFPTAVSSVVLETDGGAGLRYRASTTDYFPGLPALTFSGPVPAERRVRLEFAQPVHKVRLEGFGFLYAVREVLSPAGTKPEDVVTRSVVLHDVKFVDAGLPVEPLDLGTVNLQQPMLPGTTAPPASLGFSLHWTPAPPSGATGPVPWPADADAAPPFEANGFEIERRRVDTNGDFEPIDDKDARTLAFGSRGAAVDEPQLWSGVDLELAFPESAPPTAPVPPFMSLDDVLVTADPGGSAGTTGPPPGSLHQYRIFSLDALGRRSAVPRDGSVVRLEKRLPPPQPVGPPRDPDAVVPAGVRARVLQKLDPDLPAADRTLLGTSTNAVVLEWGWTQAERDRDPHAHEFRVYWQPLPADVVSGAVTGGPTISGALFEMPATLDRPLAQDAMAGRWISLPDYPFRIASHTAGQSIVLRLERSVLEPQRMPAPADFEFRPTLDGSEQRPPAWAERTVVVPIGAAESYRHAFRDRLQLDAAHPRTRVWVGVSTADDQSYVDDALPAAVSNGGRPGNESAIAVSDAAARFLGRPQFVVPPPLPAVPEVVVDEPAGDGVLAVVDLPALLASAPIPAGHRVQLDRISLDDVVGRMSANANGTIGAALPGGATSSYTLGNPTDQADLIEQIRTGEPARVENRFLMDFVLRFATALEPLWLQALPAPVAFGVVTDTLPPKAGRWVHRIRIADPAGHVSAGAAIAPQVVRVPSLRSPSPPQIATTALHDGSLRVEARVREAFDVAWVLLFESVEDAAVAANGNLRDAAQLLRLPNARDRYPDDGLRLRLADATLLAPATVIAADSGTVDPPDRVLSTTLAPGHDRRVALWAVTMTRDGITSRTTGPVVATTGPPPLVAPDLVVIRANGFDTASWTALDPPALLAIERSLDRGTTFEQVSPWLGGEAKDYAMPVVPGPARYRAVLRADRGRTGAGESWSRPLRPSCLAPGARSDGAPDRSAQGASLRGHALMAPFAAPIDAAGWTLTSAAPVTVPAGLRYAGTPLAALRAVRATPGQVRAPAPGVLRSLVPAAGPLAGRTVVEVQVNPFRIRQVVQAIAFGLPTFYLVLDAGSAIGTFVSGDVVPEGAPLATATGVTILCAGQDRLARDAALWSAQIGAAIAAVGADPGTWPAFVGAVATQTATGANPPVLLLDHAGAPLSDADVQLTIGAQSAVARLVTADGGDLQRAVARLHAANPAQMPFTAVFGTGATRIGGATSADAELTRLEDGAGASGSIEIAPTTRHVTFTDLKRWFAQQYANPSLPASFAPLADYTRGNRVTPLVNGPEYYADLLDKLKQAAAAGSSGGLHLVGGWQTVIDAQLARRDDDETATDHPVTLLEAATLLSDAGGGARVLSPQFFQFEQGSTPETAEIIVVTLLVEGLILGHNVSFMRSDAAGLVILGALLIGNALLVPWLIDVNGRPFEPNLDAVEELDALSNGVSRFAPFPARVEDNPLSPPLGGFPWDSLLTLDRHFGFYHQKFGVVRAGADFYGYAGGIDINPNRLDDDRHVARGPYHDVHARVEGPAARDVALSFEQRWGRDGSGPVAFPTPAATALGTPGGMAAQVARTYYRPADPIRALPWAPDGDRTIVDTLLRAIDEAREFIYIEDQYFTAAPEFQARLVGKVADRDIRALVIVLPAIGDQPFGEQVRSGFIADLKAADGGAGIVRIGYPRRHYTVPDNDARASSGRLVLQTALPSAPGINPTIVLGPKARVPVPPFWVAIEGELMYVVNESTAPNPNPQTTAIYDVVRGADTRLVKGGVTPVGARTREHSAGAAATVVDVAGIYVHAKSTIVDDVFLAIGSANINRRGHYHDGEIAIYSVPQRLKASRSNPVAALRRRLWAEMLDLPLATAEPLLEDPIAAAKLFDRSPLYGNRFTDIEAYPIHLMQDVTGGDGIVLTLLTTALGFEIAGNVQELYDGVIDPTSALELDP